MRTSLKFATIMTSIAFCLPTQAKVKLPTFFTDSMVVQQKAVLTIPGQTEAGRLVSVNGSWNKKTICVTADAKGHFEAKLPTPKAGGPYTITINDGEPLVLNEVLVGEVWLCSGQSNMEMPIMGWGRVMDCINERANALYPNIRLLQVKHITSFAPQNDTELNLGSMWRSCTPGSAENFSACAYFYGRALHKALNVPIGLIDCSWGGTVAEAWTPYDTLRHVSGFENELDFMKKFRFSKAYYQKQKAEKLYAGLDLTKIDASWTAVQVPLEWDQTGTDLVGRDGNMMQSREVEIPASWAGKDIVLHLGLIDDNDVTFYGDTQVGATKDAWVQRQYTVPGRLVKAGRAVINVNIEDLGGRGGMYSPVEEVYMECQGERISLAGQWRYRWLSGDYNFDADSPNLCSVLYNAMLHPLHVMPVAGTIWYQGCSNVDRAEQYSPLMRGLIRAWRDLWKQPKMPFYLVQLAAFLQPLELQPESQWAALRQSQTEALRLPHVGMATAIDIGHPTDIHPKNKQEVARRLAALALNRTYGFKKEICVAPTVTKVQLRVGEARLTFSAPVITRGSDEVRGVIIEQGNGVFVRTSATLEAGGRTLVVRCPDGSTPLSVRYDWADYPDGNLYGDGKLPVTPFRTDRLH